jgi:hypothetical protein
MTWPGDFGVGTSRAEERDHYFAVAEELTEKKRATVHGTLKAAELKLFDCTHLGTHDTQ